MKEHLFESNQRKRRSNQTNYKSNTHTHKEHNTQIQEKKTKNSCWDGASLSGKTKNKQSKDLFLEKKNNERVQIILLVNK